jgi:NAD(P)H-nitrite reductase large subunit
METSNEKDVKLTKGSRTLVKCMVCGEIFDSALENCPVCGVGSDFFSPVEVEAVEYKKNTEEVFVILGNGAAGVSAAEAIRERNETAAILMISNEAVISYKRPMLTKSLSTLTDVKEIAIHEENWYERNRIQNILNSQVKSIDVENKKVILEDSTQIVYDKCIYALGAECFIPPFNGAGKPRVIAIRTIADVNKIREMKSNVKNVVVIGGGVLGLEAAWEMSKSAAVTVLEVADKLMVRQLDDAAGTLMGEIIQGVGIQFRINAKIVEITGGDTVSGVKLESGEIYPADLVIVSCGVRANTNVASQSGITIDRAVVVNEKMETNAKDIYACGDCAVYNGVNYAIWPQATEMGKVAGANAAGDLLEYQQVPAALTFEGMNTALYAAGDNGKLPGKAYQTIEYRDDEKKLYEKYYFLQEKLVGAILIGDTSKMIAVGEALKEGCSYQKMRKQ